MSKYAVQLSALSLSRLLASIFGPNIYDDPRFGGHLPEIFREMAESHGGAVSLNPQPLPPKVVYARAVADTHIRGLLALDRMGALLGGEVAQRTLQSALSQVADMEDLCPTWPIWRGWPPPGPPPPWLKDEMDPIELFVYGTRFIAASDVFGQEKLGAALTQLGEKALTLSMQNS